jgi:hypothetical protein
MLQTAKKAFYHGIIPTCSDITHTGAYAVTLKQLTIALAGVLRSTITVKHQSFGWSPQVISLPDYPYGSASELKGMVANEIVVLREKRFLSQPYRPMKKETP